MTAMDWNELAEQSLPSLSGNMEPSRSHRVHELPAASQSLFGSSSSAFPSTGAYYRPVLSVGGASTAPKKRWESIEQRLERHQAELLRSVLEHTAEDTRQKTSALIDRQLTRAWEKQRDVWLKELIGTRTLGGAAADPLSTLVAAGDARSRPAPRPAPLVPAVVTTGFRSTPLARLEPSVVQAHLSVIQKMTDTFPMHDMVRLVSQPLSGHLAIDSGYRAAWHLLECLSERPSTASAVDRAAASLAHFCQQFRQHVVGRVRQAGLAGQRTSTKYDHDMADQCAAYVQLTLADASLHSWATLYYCLRCGDAVAAAEVLERTPGEPAVMRCVADLAAVQREASSVWEQPQLPRLHASDQEGVLDLLESAKNQGTANAFQLGFYALCSGSAMLPSDSATGFSTIEDYLTGGLWKAALSASPTEELVQLGETIQEYGPSYFGDDESGGWTFVLPLMATQQYQKALSYLGDAGGPLGLLQAAHVALALSSLSIPVTNLGETGGSSNITASLLVALANQLLTEPAAGSSAALEYLVRIPNKVRAVREVATLIATTGDTETLVGTVNEEGMRQGGAALNTHFSATEISSILAEAAEQLLRDKGDAQRTGAAAMCYMLAGQYVDVLRLLSQLLSPPDRPDSNRQFWIEQAKSFHKHYLSKRSHVVEMLEKQKAMSVVKTNEKLLALNEYFGLVQSGRMDEAWAVADRVGLLPKSPSDLVAKEASYQSLDPLVKEALPALVVAAVETLSREHRRVKVQAQGGAAAAVARERLRELQTHVRLLVSYAGMLPMDSDKLTTLTSLESLMI